MSLPVFISSQLTGTVTLDGAEGHHAVVKRMSVGEQLTLVDGRGGWARGTVTGVTKKTVTVEVAESGQDVPRHPRITVVQALPKADRSEQAVDLATQAGADRIIPWQAERCVARWGNKEEKGRAKWSAAAIAAAKQCRRTWIPQIEPVQSTVELCQSISQVTSQDGALVLLFHEEAATPIKDFPIPAEVSEVWILIGPEGGIGEDESEALRTAGAQPVVMGPEIFRSASAACAAIVAIDMKTSRW